MVEVADVEGRVDDVEAGEDDHDHGGEGDEAPGHQAEAGHGAGAPRPLRGGEPQRGVRQVEAARPVTLAIRDLVSRTKINLVFWKDILTR